MSWFSIHSQTVVNAAKYAFLGGHQNILNAETEAAVIAAGFPELIKEVDDVSYRVQNKNHASYAECLKDANPVINGDTTSKHSKDLKDYAYARSLGLQPKDSSGVEARKTLQEAGA